MPGPGGPDPERAAAGLKRRLADAQVQVADGFATLVRSAPPQRLEQIMRTPVRRVVLEGVFRQMPQYLDRRIAAGIDSTIEWQITGRSDGGADTYRLQIADGRCRVNHGSTDTEPRLKITVDGAEFLRLATGNSDPMQAYFKGKVALAGDIMLAAKLSSLFRIPASDR